MLLYLVLVASLKLLRDQQVEDGMSDIVGIDDFEAEASLDFGANG